MTSETKIGRVALGALLTAALGAGTATAATAAIGPGKVVAQDLRATATDGARFAIWIGVDDVVHVVDARDADGSYTTPLPASCAGSRLTAIAGSAAIAGSGQLVLTCQLPGEDARSSPNVRLDLAARSWHVLPTSVWPERADLSSVFPRPGAVGARWLQIDEVYGTTALIDLAGRELRRPVGRATDAVDLDAVEPLRAMCTPLERSLPSRWDSAPPFLPATYDGETLLAVNGRGLSVVTVQRCGEPRPTELTEAYASRMQLGAGVVSYEHDNGLAAYLPACRVQLTWALRRASLRAVAHTADAIWAWTTRGDASELHRIALPRACATLPRARVAPAGGRARTLTASDWDVRGVTAARRLPLPGAAMPRFGRAGRMLTVRTTRRASALTWQVAGSRGATRAIAIGRGGRTWRITPPRRAGGRTVTVAAQGVTPGGGAARFQFALSR